MKMLPMHRTDGYPEHEGAISEYGMMRKTKSTNNGVLLEPSRTPFRLLSPHVSLCDQFSTNHISRHMDRFLQEH